MPAQGRVGRAGTWRRRFHHITANTLLRRIAWTIMTVHLNNGDEDRGAGDHH
jgi:hypothetical protein